MAETNANKVKRLEKEVRRRDAKIAVMVKERDALLKRAEAAENASRVMMRAYELLVIRVGLRFGDHVMDEERGKSIGRRLRLPFVDKPDELLAMWQAKARKDEEARETVIAVGLRDDPDDHKHDAELEAEAEAYKARKEGATV